MKVHGRKILKMVKESTVTQMVVTTKEILKMGIEMGKVYFISIKISKSKEYGWKEN